MCRGINQICVLLLFVGICLMNARVANAVPDVQPLQWEVVHVRPIYRKETVKAFQQFSNQFRSLAEELERQGKSDKIRELFRSLSEYYKKQADSPWNGSGWIYFPKQDPAVAFVITNKDIAGQAGSVNIQFEDQKKKEILNTPIIYIDPIYDIAIIAVARNELPSECQGLELAETNIKVTSEVWLAGFLSYGDSSPFSATNGTVRTAEAPGPDGAKYFVHTALASPGNNGGPLLVEADSNPKNSPAEPIKPPAYRVAGMNAWPIVGESSTNFAIPVEIVKAAISAAQKAHKTSRSSNELSAALHSSTTRLANELGSHRPNDRTLSSLVSYTFVDRHPEIMYIDLLKLVTHNMSDEEEKDFLQFPVEYSRKTLLELFRETFATGASNIGAVKFEGLNENDKISTNTEVRSIYKIASKGEEISWIWERGDWRIANVSFPEEIQNKLNYITSKFKEQGFKLFLSSTDTSTSDTSLVNSDASMLSTETLVKHEPKQEPAPVPVVHRERGSSFMIWAGEGRRGAIGDNFQMDLRQKQFSAFGFELAFPFSRYFSFCTGLGYGPLGVEFETTVGGKNVTIDEDPMYVQLPLLFRFEIPVETHYLTVRISGKAGLSGNLLVQREGTMRDTMGGMINSLSDPNLNWFTNHNSENIGVVYGGALEFGLGESPGLYFGAEVVSEKDLLREWSSNVFGGGANYRYEALRAGLFVKYQSLH